MDILDKMTRGRGKSINSRAHARALKRERIMILEEELAEIEKQLKELPKEREKRRKSAELATAAYKQCVEKNGNDKKQANMSQ